MLYMENARNCFATACDRFYDSNSECEFYHKFSRMIPDRVDVDTLILALKIALRESEREEEPTAGFIGVIPRYIRQCASPEFSHEFKEKFDREILGLDREPIPDVDYGIVEVQPNVIDISDKDRNEVLAALYNAATPVGAGFYKYDPMPWTKETAAQFIEQVSKNNLPGTINLDYVMGRPLKCNFVGDLVYVAAYNYDNEPGLAQRVIATCPNISQKRQMRQEDKPE